MNRTEKPRACTWTILLAAGFVSVCLSIRGAGAATEEQDPWSDDAPAAATPEEKPAEKPEESADAADEKDVEGSPDDAERAMRVQRLFDRHWFTYARWFRPFGENYVLFSYDTKYPNSRGLTLEQARDQLSTTRKVKVPGYNIMRDEKVYGPQGEAEAFAYAIPELKPGAYGFVYSFVVDRVLGPQEMIVSQMWILDPEAMRRERTEYERQIKWHDGRDREIEHRYFKIRSELQRMPERDRRWQRVKVVGFPTKDLPLGVRWNGPRGKGVQVVFLGYENLQNDSRQPPMHVAVLEPADTLKTGLNKEQFADLLEKHGYSTESFVELVQTELRLLGSKEALPSILSKLEMGKVKADRLTTSGK